MSDLARIPVRDLYQRPELMVEAVSVAEHMARAAAAMQRWPEMEQAVDAQIERQRLIVTWWGENVRPGGRLSGGESQISAHEAELIVNLSQPSISRLRRALADPEYRARVIGKTMRLVAWRQRDPNATRSSPARSGPDFWPTPESLIQGLLTMLPQLPPGPVWEPACGDGRLVRALQDAGRGEVFSSDLYPRRGMPRDFLSTAPPAEGCLVITNPPFNAADGFIERGLALLDQGAITGLVLLLRHDHLTAGGRVAWLNRATLQLHCNWRPVWIEGSEGQPRWSFCWMMWLRGMTRLPPVYLGLSDLPSRGE
jgi:hypothetical protein